MSLTNEISQKLKDETDGIEWLGDQIVLLDAEKEQWDGAVKTVDGPLVVEIDEVNQTLANVKSAYDDRITVGCRTDMFWRILGIDGTASPTEYDLVVTKISLNGYDDISSSGTGIGTMLAYVAVNGGITSLPLNSKIGITSDNLHGIKYYNEPYLRDVGDTTVGNFIGTVGTGSTVLTIMEPYADNLWANFEVGQLITCEKDGVVSGGSDTIAGITSAVTDLSGIGTIYNSSFTTQSGIGITVSPVILLTNGAVGFATAPESDGKFVVFNVLDDPTGIITASDYAVDFGTNPFSPQTLGIMNGDRLGIGTWVEYNNAGLTSSPQSWRPEYESTGFTDLDIPDVVAPPVGSGEIYYIDGWTAAPTQSGAKKVEGSTVTGVTDLTSGIYTNLPSCSSEDTAVTNAINARNTKESAFASDISSFNDKLTASNALRVERDELNARIYMARTGIGAAIKDKERLEALQRHIDEQGLDL